MITSASPEPILVTIRPDGRSAAARSRVYQLLGAAFSYPSTPGICTELLEETPWASISDAWGELPYALSFPAAPTCADMTRWSPAVVENLYLSLFDRSVARTAVSMLEREYGSSAPQLLSEKLSRFYDHFGLDLTNGHMKEPVDHLLLELEFLHYLTFLEAGSAADKQPFVTAQYDFLTCHVAIWIPKFCAEVRNANTDGPYGFLAMILEVFIAADLCYLRKHPGNSSMILKT